MENKKTVRPLIILSEDLEEVLDNRETSPSGNPEHSDYCFQLRASKYAMRLIFEKLTTNCCILNIGQIHPIACGTPHCVNYYKNQGNCAMIMAQLREHLEENDIFVKAFEEYNIGYQSDWKKAEPPQLVWEEEE